MPALLIANKLDTVHRRAEIAPWLQSMQQRHTFAEFVPMSAKNAKDIERLFGICEKYLPEQPWAYGEDELTDRSERFLASEIVREKLFRFTGDELPYTSTVVIDKFEDEFGRNKSRLARIAATIVVERDGHKAMVIGDKGERIKRIGMETRVELEKLADAFPRLLPTPRGIDVNRVLGEEIRHHVPAALARIHLVAGGDEPVVGVLCFLFDLGFCFHGRSCFF